MLLMSWDPNCEAVNGFRVSDFGFQGLGFRVQEV